MFFTDARSYLLGSVADSDDEDQVPWQTPSMVDDSQAASFSLGSVEEGSREDSDMGDDESQPDDTFHFKKFGVEL